MKCKICSREAKPQTESHSNYCELHEKAYQNILQKYEGWKKALDIQWEEYLKEIVGNLFTGMWAKEVAEDLLKKEMNVASLRNV